MIRRAIKLGFLVLVALLGTATFAQVAPMLPINPPPDPPPPIQWLTQNLSQLQGLYNSASVVSNFITTLTNGDIDTPPVAEYTFANLGGDGNLELLVTLGSNYTNDLIVVSQVGTTYNWQEIDGDNIDNLTGRILQLDSTGGREVVITNVVGDYNNAVPVPTFTHVYRWTGTQLVQADSQFKSYYSTVVLPQLQQQLANATTGADRAEGTMQTLTIQVLNQDIAAVQALINQP